MIWNNSRTGCAPNERPIDAEGEPSPAVCTDPRDEEPIVRLRCDNIVMRRSRQIHVQLVPLTWAELDSDRARR